MPGRHDPASIDPSLCRRCQSNPPAITVRTEPLCKSCFCRYVSTKVVKRMESFRVRHSEPGNEKTLLLPLSFGPCSTALLHVLSEQMKGQAEKTGRSGFKLHILHVQEYPADDDPEGHLRLAKVKQRFPEHVFSSARLSELPLLEDLISLFGKQDEQRDADTSKTAASTTLEGLLSLLSSATSRVDVIQIVRQRLIVNFAKDHNCESILWGHSTTRLAERTLAETAKGRGFALPWTVLDGESPHGLTFLYPMRELLSKEVMAFTSIVDPPLDDLVLAEEPRRSVSTKNTSIDDLMRQYFESVERDYPSVVANVVRTTGKLQAASLSVVGEQCELCEMPLSGAAPERSRVCYGCIRNLPQTSAVP